MKFIKVNDENIVVFIHNEPFHEKYGMGKTEQELLKEGYLIESIPDYDTSKQVLKYANNEFVLEDLPESELSDIERLKLENGQLKEQLDKVVETLDFVLVDVIPNLLGGGETE